MSEYEPGTVAVLTFKDGTVTRGVLATDGMWHTALVGSFEVGSQVHTRVTVVRPLVVIDPEDAEQVERLMNGVLAIVNDRILTRGVRAVQAALREFANPAPPKPPEPQGLGAVVEDAEGRRYVRHCPSDCEDGRLCIPWHSITDAFNRTYDEFDAVRVLSEGVPA